jgi:hypothetical protein
MPHQSSDDVDGGSGFKQFGCYAMSEAMNPNMDTLLGLDAELCDRTVYTVLDHNCLRDMAGPSSSGRDSRLG